MKTIRLIVNLTVNDENSDKESEEWFINHILFGEELLFLHSNEVGCIVGEVEVLEVLNG